MTTAAARPLSGYKVIDLTANMTGPYATMLLAAQGADVVKVEPPGGEVIRRVGTGRDGMSAYFANLNRDKRSIVIDLSHADGVEVALRLLADADVLVQNFRPGVIEQLGLGADVVCARYPTVVYASISGFGRVGPLADAPAYDHVVQALSGMAARQSDGRGGPPALVRHGLIDKLTGLFAAQAITAALLRRAKTGVGGQIDVAMLDAAIHFLWPDGMMNHTCLDEVVELPPVAAGFRLTETADGHVAMITVTDHQWQGLLRAVDLRAASERPDLLTVEGRMRHGGTVMREVATLIRSLPTDDVVERMRANDVPCMPVVALEELARHPQVVAANLLEETDHPVLGRIVQPRAPARFVDTAEPESWGAPTPGQDTDGVLASAGYGSEEIRRLRAAGAVA